jgi:ABC-2 type transport system ATP-binding protein
VQGIELDHVGHLAFGAGVELHELSRQGFDLEDLFFQLTAEQAPGGAQMGSAQ